MHFLIPFILFVAWWTAIRVSIQLFAMFLLIVCSQKAPEIKIQMGYFPHIFSASAAILIARQESIVP